MSMVSIVATAMRKDKDLLHSILSRLASQHVKTVLPLFQARKYRDIDVVFASLCPMVCVLVMVEIARANQELQDEGTTLICLLAHCLDFDFLGWFGAAMAWYYLDTLEHLSPGFVKCALAVNPASLHQVVRT